MTLAQGTVLGGYRIERLLGRGGMGEVYLAEQLRLHRRVALKLISPGLAQEPRFRDRFVRESQLAASLDHPNIVPIYEAGEVEGRHFLAMRYVTGPSLERLLREEGPLERSRALRILGGIAAALDAAHAAGLVHRDVKPENILLAEGSEHPYLVDFGLTKHTSYTFGMTTPGQLIGSVDYVAPEQIEGQAVDARVDVYSLGCVMYEVLAGAPPFRRETELATIWAHLQADRPPISAVRGELADLDPVIARAMAVDREARFPSAGAFVAAAREAMDGAPPRNGAAHGLAPTAMGAEPRPVSLRESDSGSGSSPSIARVLDIPAARFRPERRPRPRSRSTGIAALALAAPLVLGVGAALGIIRLPGPTDGTAGATASSPPATAPGGEARPLPRSDASYGVTRLSPGVYRTVLFQPAISVALGAGWQTSGDRPGSVGLGREGGTAEIVFARILTVFDGACPPGPVAIGPAPLDLVRALEAREDLKLSAPQAVSYAGAIGLSVDITVNRASCRDVGPGALLFQVGQGERMGAVNATSRLIALDVDGQTLSIDIAAGEGDLDAFWETAHPVLRSLTIE